MTIDLKFIYLSLVEIIFAEVVKLANTLRSGRSERELLRVRVPSSAVLENKKQRKDGYGTV